MSATLKVMKINNFSLKKSLGPYPTPIFIEGLFAARTLPCFLVVIVQCVWRKLLLLLLAMLLLLYTFYRMEETPFPVASYVAIDVLIL